MRRRLIIGVLLFAIAGITAGSLGMQMLSAANVQSENKAKLAAGDYGYNCDGVSGTMTVYGQEIKTNCVGVEAGGKRCLDRPQESRKIRNVRQVGEVTEGGLTCPIWEYDRYREDFGYCRGDGIKYCMCDNPDITSNVDNGDDYWANRWGCKNIAESDYNAIGIGGDGWEHRWVRTGTKRHGGVVGACQTSIGSESFPAEDTATYDGFTVETDNHDTQKVVSCTQNEVIASYDRDRVVASVLQVGVDIPKTEITGAVRDLTVDRPNQELVYTIELYNNWHPIDVEQADVTFLGSSHTVIEDATLDTGTTSFHVSQPLNQTQLSKLYVDQGTEYQLDIAFTGASIPQREIEGTPDLTNSMSDGEVGVPPEGWSLGTFRVQDSTIGGDVTICDDYRHRTCLEEVGDIERELGGQFVQFTRMVRGQWTQLGEFLRRVVFTVFGV
ncbi:hypothetical protein G3I44_14260 [Halogeometricum borinquense]|uniref:Uncharacterized protein n=1 Tax=Halogeometricum borinquense TaxID=60847 RepID=A0A6C0UN77_9EURY|nr:hypothetical protein [Halogeometricum borinquense]QIB75349.1 hypothetical protein G3I44_14260 [Halogeometricum borinquense]